MADSIKTRHCLQCNRTLPVDQFDDTKRKRKRGRWKHKGWVKATCRKCTAINQTKLPRKDREPTGDSKRCNGCREFLPIFNFDRVEPKGRRNDDPNRRLGTCRWCVAKEKGEAWESRKKAKPCQESANTYAERDKVLLAMGFSSYAKYLASPLWKSIRQRVYRKKGRACIVCGMDATALHHDRYEKPDLSGKRLAYIVPICDPCHRWIEFRGENKRNMEDARRALRQITGTATT